MTTTIKQVTERGRILDNETVIGPIGGFSNYVRFLVLLDDRYNRYWEVKVHEEGYKNMRGEDWPQYPQFIANDFNDVNPWIVKEIEQQAIEIVDFSNAEKKIEFIKTQVFPKSRTWHNWLRVEWEYRRLMNELVFVGHDYRQDVVSDKHITLMLTINPELAYRAYLKFNSNLNNRSPEEFMDKVDKLNQQHINIAQQLKNAYVLDSSKLWQDTLDSEWYQQLCKIFAITPRYDQAQQIHTLWYQGHQRAEQELLEHFETMYR